MLRLSCSTCRPACRSAAPLPDDSIRYPRLTGHALTEALQQAQARFGRAIVAHLAFARASLQASCPL